MRGQAPVEAGGEETSVDGLQTTVDEGHQAEGRDPVRGGPRRGGWIWGGGEPGRDLGGPCL